MKRNPFCVVAVITILCSVFGLCSLPFLAMIVQYIDSAVGFSGGQGYYADSSAYLLESPLVYLLTILCVNIVLGISYLVYAYLKEKGRGL